MEREAEVRVMQTAEAYLDIIRKRGSKRLPLEEVYRHLFNPALYLLAYAKISRNAGALTPGVTTETVDGMSLKKIQDIIEALRYERYRWTPVRRIYIEKRHSTKKRPLGIPVWSDKLLQEVIRLMLEAYYEPQFSRSSHGFRQNRGCGTALSEIYHRWNGTTWFIEGDIRACFDSLDHQVLLSILGESFHDNRFLRLVEAMLKAGYLEDWEYHATHSGSPQGGVISPILSNIYLDRLDKYIEHIVTPAYTRGTRRANYLPYQRLSDQMAATRSKGRTEGLHALRVERANLPSGDPEDPNYRRLRYVRYADDWLLGFAGPRSEAEEIKGQIGQFLHDVLKLELSEEKTLITHARTQRARFLNHEVETLHANMKRTHGRRTVNGGIGLCVPHDVVESTCRRYMANGKPIHRAELLNDSVFTIVALYDAEYRGVVNYWRGCYNLHKLNRLRYVMSTSLAKTLAHKLGVSAAQVWKQFKTKREGKVVLTVSEAREGRSALVAVFPSTNLRWKPGTMLVDRPGQIGYQGTELVQRLLADTCELCGSQDSIEVHHVRALKDLHRPGRPPRPEWATVMSARRRKTLVLCHDCHVDIQHGHPRRHAKTPRVAGEPGAVKVARPVRRGADGKVPA
jgi:group II intron reverse transcriptase/maturase